MGTRRRRNVHRRRPRAQVTPVRRRTGGRRTAVLTLLVAAAMGISYLLLFSPVFWVQHVKVEGVRTLSAADLRERVAEASEYRFGPLSTRSIFLFDKQAVAGTLSADISEISRVSLTTQLPGTVVLSVTERRSTLLWRSGEEHYLVDQRGVAYEKTEPRDDILAVEDSTDLPVEVGEQVVGGNFIVQLEEIRTSLKERGFAVERFEIPESTFEVRAVTEQGWYALFDTTRAVEPQAEALQLAVARERPTEYADLRVPGRVYVR